MLTSVPLALFDVSNVGMLDIVMLFFVLGSNFLLNTWGSRWIGVVEFRVGLCKAATTVSLLVMTVSSIYGDNFKHDSSGFR